MGKLIKLQPRMVRKPAGREPELRQIFVSSDPLRMQMVRDWLDRGGIETFVFDDQSSRLFGSTAVLPSRLMVAAEDAEEALDQLRRLGFAD